MEESTSWERTFVLVKPDGVLRGLVGAILGRFERAGLSIVALRMLSADRELAEKHYEGHRGKTFFGPLVDLLVSGPVVAAAVEGAHAISVVRKIVGSTEPREAAPGTIRGDFCHMGYDRSRERLGVIPNLIHASDSPESAEWETSLWFAPGDYAAPYERTDHRFL